MSTFADFHELNNAKVMDSDASEPEQCGDAVEVSDEHYSQILKQVRELSESIATPAAVSMLASPHSSAPSPVRIQRPAPFVPVAPSTLEESGLSVGLISDLILKLVYLQGTLTGSEISRQIKLPFGVILEPLRFLRNERCLEVSSGELVGPVSHRFVLTDRGRQRAREAFADCRYVGPAPVSLKDYTVITRIQSPRGILIREQALRNSLSGVVLDDSLIQRLGPAVCSGKSIYLYGPPGSGKTVIAKAIGRLFDCYGGTILLPYSICVDHQIVSVFDPALHQVCPEGHSDHHLQDAIPNSEESSQPEPDHRWKQVRRPVVMVGGELTLEMLDLRFQASSGIYTAPLHLKANGGVLIIDDFGRQLVPPAQLLGRWNLPLEEGIDLLTLATGKKFAVPFSQLTVFSGNLAPHELADGAFIRRIRHKIGIGEPSERQFREIFRQQCESRQIKYDDWLINRLLSQCYNPQNPPKSCDPRDLLEVIESICRFRGERPHLSEKILFEAFGECLKTPPPVAER